MLDLQTRFLGNVFIIHCEGRIVGGAESDALEAALDRGSREFTRIVLNLAGVDRLDSLGLGLLVRYAQRLKKPGGDLRLAESPPFVLTLLDLTCVSTIIRSFPTEEEAILSFLRQQSAPAPAPALLSRRLLVFDPSADLCVFVRTVLTQHGFDVRTSCLFRDAKLLLRAHPVDYILAGPGTPRFSSEEALEELSALAPKAHALRLTPDFKSKDALQATELLLQIFDLRPGGVPAGPETSI